MPSPHHVCSGPYNSINVYIALPLPKHSALILPLNPQVSITQLILQSQNIKDLQELKIDLGVGITSPLFFTLRGKRYRWPRSRETLVVVRQLQLLLPA